MYQTDNALPPRGFGQIAGQPPASATASVTASATAFANWQVCSGWPALPAIFVSHTGEQFDEQWSQLYTELNGIGALTMTDTWQVA